MAGANGNEASDGNGSTVVAQRWWNVKHPAAYAQRLAAGEWPRHDGEMIDTETARVERIMLETRLRSGLGLDALSNASRAAVPGLVDRGLAGVFGDHMVLTQSGRLLADAVVRELVD